MSANTMYVLRGRLDDDSWERISEPCVDLSTCKSDAQRLLRHYVCVEIVDTTTGRVVHRATRPPIGDE